MSLTVGDVVRDARNQSTFFHKSRGTPDKLLADFLRDYQNELIGKAQLLDAAFCLQTATIVLNTGQGDLAATAGAGSTTGLPGTVSDAGVLAPVVTPAGRLVQVGVTAADGATILVSERPATSATSTTITSTGAARTVNADTTRLVVIVQGTGAGQFRQIISNTADTWVISTGSDGRMWAVTPDGTSMFDIVIPALVTDGNAGVVDALPAQLDRPGYLVRLDASGVAFIDYVAPLVARVETGIALPAAADVVGGRVQYRDEDDGLGPLTIVTPRQRFEPPAFPAVYFKGTTLFFCGDADDWDDIAALEIDYVPLAPAVVALSDVFLIRDSARSALVAAAAALLAQRTQDQPGTNLTRQTTADFRGLAADAEAAFLKRLGIGRRARFSVMREG